MMERLGQRCPRDAVTDSLVHGTLAGREHEEAQEHLETCDACRRRYREATLGRLPRLPHYTVVERIGEGGFGVVYKVVHHAKQRTEALKILFGKTPVRARYFQNEVHLIARLRHPNIATLYEAHLGKPPLYYTMDFVAGEQLDQHIRRRHLSLAKRIELIKTVAAAVGYAHAQGVVHRDIKPQNILIDADGEPHILDFGIATRLKLRDDAQRTPMPVSEGALGTLGYIAPEQMAGENVDGRADVYALGALLYHCVTGEAARLATWPDRLLRTLQARGVARAEDLAAIISRCVAPLPEQRYANCAELIDDLDHYLAGRVIRAYRNPTLGYQLARSASYVLRTRPLAVRVFLVMVVSVLLTVLAWRAEARWFGAAVDVPPISLVAFTPGTIETLARGEIEQAAGMKARDSGTWRVVLGLLLQRLATVQPQVVICDYFLPQCKPDYDAELLRGLDALRNSGVPVVMGTREIDLNSEPVMCAEIRSRVHSWGTLLSADPDERGHEWIVPVCVSRGLAPPVPGLAVAGFAAARYPDAALQLNVEPGEVMLSYRKRQVARGEQRWHTGTDRIPVWEVDRIGRNSGDGMLRAGDVVYRMHVRIDPGPPEATRRLSLEQVLAADDEQVRRWFAGQVVLVGHTLPLMDYYRTAAGEGVYGCEVHVQALRALLGGASQGKIEWKMLGATIVLWAALAAVLVGLLPAAPTWPRRLLGGVCLLALAGGIVTVALGARWSVALWQVHVFLALGTLLVSGSVVYLVNALRVRQMQLGPGPVWLADGEAASSTLLAGGKRDERSRGANAPGG
ncbi:MAG: protein kinase [Phycisphaerae bacterium]|jgi:hypothetical protein